MVISGSKTTHLYAVLFGKTLSHEGQIQRISSVEDRIWVGLWLLSKRLGVPGTEDSKEWLSETTELAGVADNDCTVTDGVTVSSSGLD